eukprot:76112_1
MLISFYAFQSRFRWSIYGFSTPGLVSHGFSHNNQATKRHAFLKHQTKSDVPLDPQICVNDMVYCECDEECQRTTDILMVISPSDMMETYAPNSAGNRLKHLKRKQKQHKSIRDDDIDANHGTYDWNHWMVSARIRLVPMNTGHHRTQRTCKANAKEEETTKRSATNHHLKLQKGKATAKAKTKKATRQRTSKRQRHPIVFYLYCVSVMVCRFCG